MSRIVENFSGRSASQTPVTPVSYCKRRYFQRVLIFRSGIRKLNETIVLIPPPAISFGTVITLGPSFFPLDIFFNSSASPIPERSMSFGPGVFYPRVIKVASKRSPTIAPSSRLVPVLDEKYPPHIST